MLAPRHEQRLEIVHQVVVVAAGPVGQADHPDQPIAALEGEPEEASERRMARRQPPAALVVRRVVRDDGLAGRHDGADRVRVL